MDMKIYVIITVCICVFTCQMIAADGSATVFIYTSDEPDRPTNVAVTHRSVSMSTSGPQPRGGDTTTRSPGLNYQPSTTTAITVVSSIPILGNTQSTENETVVGSSGVDTPPLPMSEMSSSTDGNAPLGEGSETYTTGVFDSTDGNAPLGEGRETYTTGVFDSTEEEPDANITMIPPTNMENETHNVTALEPETGSSVSDNITDTEGESGFNGTLPDYDNYDYSTIVNETTDEDVPQTNTSVVPDEPDTPAEPLNTTLPLAVDLPGMLTDSGEQHESTSQSASPTSASQDHRSTVNGRTASSTQDMVDRTATTDAPLGTETGVDPTTGEDLDESINNTVTYATRGAHHVSRTVSAGATGDRTTEHGTTHWSESTGSDDVQSVSDGSVTESGHTVLTDGPQLTSESDDSSTPVSTIDPCLSTTCHFGAKCIRGRCQCRPSCPHEPVVAPICASDNQTYMSTCDMEVTMCHRHELLTVVSYEPCQVDACAGVECPCGQTCSDGACTCTDDGMPVCADDVETYASECAMLANACDTDRTLTVRYRVPCENLTRLVDIGETKDHDMAVSDGQLLMYILIGLGCGVVLTTVIMVTIIKMRNKRSRAEDEEHVPMMPGSVRLATRVTFEERSEKQNDIDKISGCVTPLNEYTTFFPDCNGKDTADKDVGKATLVADGQQVENRKAPITNKDGRRRVLSSTDTGVSELVLEDTKPLLTSFTAPDVPSYKKDAPGAKKLLVTRPLSQIDNSVPEVSPELDTVLEFDDVFDDSFVTKL